MDSELVPSLWTFRKIENNQLFKCLAESTSDVIRAWSFFLGEVFLTTNSVSLIDIDAFICFLLKGAVVV